VEKSGRMLLENMSKGVAEFSFEYRKSVNNRRIRLSFRPGKGFLVTYPLRTPRHVVDDFVASHQGWMAEVSDRYEKSSSAATQGGSIKDWLREHPILYLDGVEHPVVFGNTGGLLRISERTIQIYEGISDRQLIGQLMELARSCLPPIVDRESRMRSLVVLRVQIRNQRTRWGSCSSGRTISLNWKLLLMPPELQLHIILHELAHLKHLNHSRQFWDLLRSWDPAMEVHREMLKKQEKQWITIGEGA
jgi:predicted metal-dependent hydrolase